MTRDWDLAPCGLLLLQADGTVLAANATFADWTGEDESLPGRRFSELLSVGGRIYWETHVAPLLHVDRRIDEVAVDLKVPKGRLPVLLSATFPPDQDLVRLAVIPLGSGRGTRGSCSRRADSPSARRRASRRSRRSPRRCRGRSAWTRCSTS